MPHDLTGLRVAFLVAPAFEQVEMTEPRKALEAAGAETDLVSIQPGEVQAMKHFDKGDAFPVDRTVEEARASDYDALVLPGGVANPTSCARTTPPSPSCGPSSTRESRSPPSATARGRWSRRMSCVDAR